MTHSDIIAALQKHWAATGPETAQTIFPGVTTNVTDGELWTEFWVTQLVEQPQRPASPLEQQLAIDVHLFSKSANKREINTLADAVITALRGAVIPVPNLIQPGTLRLKEPVARDFTRHDSTGSAVAAQHWLISIPAVAIATT